jgi:hypothetical protein
VQETISIIWDVTDVKFARPDLTKKQCSNVLEVCDAEHDASIGINWEVIRAHAEALYPLSAADQALINDFLEAFDDFFPGRSFSTLDRIWKNRTNGGAH